MVHLPKALAGRPAGFARARPVCCRAPGEGCRQNQEPSANLLLRSDPTGRVSSPGPCGNRIGVVVFEIAQPRSDLLNVATVRLDHNLCCRDFAARMKDQELRDMLGRFTGEISSNEGVEPPAEAVIRAFVTVERLR